MTRVIQPELLDHLTPEDADAIRSRRDLRRLNACMRSGAILARALQMIPPAKRLDSIIDLGGGDATVLLNVLRRMDKTRGTSNGPDGAPNQSRRAVVVDRHDVIGPDTHQQFLALGWQLEVVTMDAGAWLEQNSKASEGVILANLFLHHFSAEQLGRMFTQTARLADVFIAFEPRRGTWSGFFSQCVGLIGCGPVTRYDAAVSVRAGFRGRELSALWPKGDGWVLTERQAGLFGHLFTARRRAGVKPV